MGRGTGRRRIVKKDDIGNTKIAVIPNLEPRKTRSQSLKENQEAGIHLPTAPQEDENNFPSNYVDVTLRRSLSRAGSDDSAFSSRSSVWSRCSNVSLVNIMSHGVVTRRLTQTLDPVDEERVIKPKVDINSDTINWVNSFSSARGQAAVPLLRTRAVANGHLTKRTMSNITEGCNSDSGYNSQVLDEKFSTSVFQSEAVVHIYIFIFKVLMLSTEHHLRLASKNFSSHPMEVHPLVLQVGSSFILGILCDVISPKLALLVPQAIWLLISLLVYFTYCKVPVQLVPYLRLTNQGLIGSQLLAVHLRFRCSHAGVLARVGLSYGLAAIVSPSITSMTSKLLGSFINYQLVTLVSLLSMMAVLRLLGSNSKEFSRILPPVADSYAPAKFLICVVMKSALTIPVSLVLPWLQGLLNDGSSITGIGLPVLVTFGILLTQAVMVPLLLLCTKSSTATCAMASLLTLLYLAMVMSEESGALMLAIPICGLVAVTVNLVLAHLLTTFPHFPGVILALNLTLHILIRYFTPHFAGNMTSLCDVEGKTHLISIGFPQWFRDSIKDTFINEPFLLLPTSLDIFSCHKVHLSVMAMMGCACSILLLILARVM